MDLNSSLQEVKGIGPKTAELLEKSGFFTVRDLLYHLPRSYEAFQDAASISDIKPGKVTVKAKVNEVKTSRRRRNLSITEASLADDSGAVRAVWFNQPYRAKQFESGKEYYFSGNFEFSFGRYQLMNPSAAIASEYDDSGHKFQPIYPSRGALKSQNFAKFLNNLKSEFTKIPDLLPERIFDSLNSRAEALFLTHFPENEEDVKKGRAYLAFEELFILLLAGEFNRRENQTLKSPVIKYNLNDLKAAIARLPFKLTNAQRRTTWEIIQDLESETPMNRLLQGDVGSGKTLVAALAALISAKAGHQTALLAPTEILASQHAETIHELFSQQGLRVALLTGSTKNKSELKKHIRAGSADLIIGTHALLTDDTIFHDLGLAIIDEQHRFGVKQRQTLLQKSANTSAGHDMPHLLSMTATPIPRSLQLTVFGDLAVSILDELPAGRQPITTKIISPNSTEQMWQNVITNLRAGQQAYYICKMIEDGTELSSVKKEAAKIANKFPEFTVAYLHGKMKPIEKDEVMSKFAANKIQILVSTTVVEVGVNVPNATVMVIADADRYGLSQLHQLRGRVGRGSVASHCYLINSSSDAPAKRLKEIERSQDGFYLAEVDLKLRGPGEIYGSLQHGALDLRIASITDTKAIRAAAKAAKDFVKTNPDMLKYQELSASVRKYQRLTVLN